MLSSDLVLVDKNVSLVITAFYLLENCYWTGHLCCC